ncbi:MAG: NAD-dependent epimerase/dehydratase family protein [Planctomycetes bacterium]|nr:NAD-dependent epimerase/dehydratase family protein [Planctomycetota bacterium]
MRGFSGKTICVTGGAGFIGSHLADALVAAGARVTVLDDLSTGRLDNLAAVKDSIRFVQGSLLEPSRLAEAVGGAAIVFHLAAYVSAPGSVREPFECHEINTTGTMRLLEECRRQRTSRVVFASSAAVYGDSEVSPKSEREPMLPCSVYAQSKAAGEHLLRVWSHCHGLRAVSLRFFNVFGPRQTAGSAYSAAIAAFADALLRGRPVTIFGEGNQTRDFVPVSNVVQCLMRAAMWEGPAAGEAFNVGLGRAISIRDVSTIMANIVGSDQEPVFLPARPGDVQHSCADIGAARRVLGYEPTDSVEAGLRETLAWCREAMGSLR